MKTSIEELENWPSCDDLVDWLESEGITGEFDMTDIWDQIPDKDWQVRFSFYAVCNWSDKQLEKYLDKFCKSVLESPKYSYLASRDWPDNRIEGYLDKFCKSVLESPKYSYLAGVYWSKSRIEKYLDKFCKSVATSLKYLKLAKEDWHENRKKHLENFPSLKRKEKEMRKMTRERALQLTATPVATFAARKGIGTATITELAEQFCLMLLEQKMVCSNSACAHNLNGMCERGEMEICPKEMEEEEIDWSSFNKFPSL
ncbi:MAG: hypothetical protein PHO27_12940 [Sulfuricurvum sp.]|jgi:hypothetical protein|nr:hypothetical protein [Sulfuricurvum sp.]